MSIPKPKWKLEGHCSVWHQDQLYVYSPQGFQALTLGKNGTWKELPSDISLTGAQCVKVVPEGNPDEARLYIVGGKPNATAADWNYPGLMHYTFATQKWDWLRPDVFVTQNRVNHAAVYLKDAKSIFVYSGTRTDDPTPSSETFLIELFPPFRAKAAQGSVPLAKPQLIQWDDNTALMLGGALVGGSANIELHTFSQANKWNKLQTSLSAPIPNLEATKYSLVTGDDNSKILGILDTSVTPNKVTNLPLIQPNGEPAAPGTKLGSGKTKRLTMQDWPAYNGTNAPTAVRSAYSLAQSEQRTIIISGGSDDEPLAIFDQDSNEWQNTTELFAGKQLQNILQPTSTSSGSSSSSPSSTPTAGAIAPPAAAPVNNKSRMLTVLGATLGAIFGIAAILILLLFCLKYKKNKNKNNHGGYVEKDRLSFADRGADYMSEAGGRGLNDKFVEANASSTSLAIIAGRATGHKKGMGSDASTAGLIKKSSPLGYSETVELSKFDLKPEPNPETLVRQNSGRIPPPPVTAANATRSRSSGWSRYFANNEATNLAQMPSDRSTFGSERTSTGSQSMYTNSRMYSQPSQAVAPLDVPKFDQSKFDGQRMSNVVRGSPSLGNSQEDLPDSSSSTISGYSRDDHYLRNGVDSWSPVNNDDRPASSNYTGSVVIDDYRQGANQYYADNASSYYPKSNMSSFYPGQKLGAPEVRDSTATLFPSAAHAHNAAPPSSQPQNNTFSDFYPAPPRIGVPTEGRESTVTVFPGLQPGADPKTNQTDMSWLNLGTSAK
ncbi:hypothetical protein DM02DRAFT_638120 [Periconia macrospinosa]|uniref:Galactose oxidase n=1 Tax=Periconia macrospinosa TaxID=97972 RepID=A0A2V1E9P8_9PLEO|nr:hypothetical protein DM02DRAFT_638120 [Periconia macrospinosa]